MIIVYAQSARKVSQTPYLYFDVPVAMVTVLAEVVAVDINCLLSNACSKLLPVINVKSTYVTLGGVLAGRVNL